MLRYVNRVCYMKVNIACLQMASKPYDWDYNIEKATAMIKEAVNNGADICVLPEVFIPGYSLTDENFRQAEPLDGPTVSILKQMAKELNVYITGSIIEKTKTEFFNTMVFVGPKGLMGTYHKMNVFSLEQKYWKRGNEGTIVNTEFGTIGLGICADMIYPPLWKQYPGKVDLILICSAWPESPSGIKLSYTSHFTQLCKDLPIQISKVFHIPTAYCNACHVGGTWPLNLGFMCCAGLSEIVDRGRVVASANSRKEQIIQAVVETSKDRPLVNPIHFKNWIKYPLREKILRLLVEKLAAYYASFYYRRNKKKYLD